jgi:hypothetical protein
VHAAAWLAEFDRRGEEFRAAAAARHRALGPMRAEVRAVARPVVLEAGREVDVDADQDRVPSSALRLAAGAGAAGWAVRVMASSAADPTRGLVNVVTVRARRHDERVWAAWWNGSFDVAWYVGPTGLERLGWARLGGKRKIPLKVRGVLDVIEGVRGPKQWVDLLEHQEMARATGLISQAFPGLCLTRQ